MNENNMDESLKATYVSDVPDINFISEQYQTDVNSTIQYRARCRISSDLRRRKWLGKSWDLKKHGADKSPWDGASDTEVPKVEQAISTLVALCMTALRRGNLRALPIGPSDAKRSAEVSNFINYLVRSNTPSFMTEMERAANHLFEKEMAVTYVGWEGHKPKALRSFTIDQLRDLSEIRSGEIGNGGIIDIEVDNEDDAAIIELFTDPLREDEAVEAIMTEFPSVKRGKARRAVRSLRETGTAVLPIDMPRVSNPMVKSLSPNTEVFFPSYTQNIDKADRCHVRFLLTAQEINSIAAEEGWDNKWVEAILANCSGKIGSIVLEEPDFATYEYYAGSGNTEQNLYEVIYTFVKLFDEEDESEGIYRIVWSPAMDNLSESDHNYGLFVLESGLSTFPVRHTSLSNAGNTIYDGESIGTLLHGNQRHAKVTRDSFIDQLSISLNPSTKYPAGSIPPKRGPGASNPIMPGMASAYQTDAIPDTSRSGIYVEEYIDRESDAIVGLRDNSNIDVIRQQEYVNKFLHHVSKVCQAIWEAFLIHGDESVMYRVSDTAELSEFSKDPREEAMDVRIEYDIQYNNPEFVEKTIVATSTLLSLDTEGTINRRRAMTVLTQLALPTFSSFIIEGEEESRDRVISDVQNDIAKIWSGQPSNARPSGATIALEYIEGYVSQPDVAARLASDPAFAQRLNTYVEQYRFQIQQTENAVIGRMGTAPAGFVEQ